MAEKEEKKVVDLGTSKSVDEKKVVDLGISKSEDENKADLAPPPGTPGPKIPIEDTEGFKCTRCGFEVFEERTIIRVLTAEQSDTGKKKLVPVKILRCEVCKTATPRLG